MKKPHEQEWTQSEYDRFTVRAAGGRLIACTYTDNMDREEAYDIGRLIAAAPDMARALLGCAAAQRGSDGRPCWCASGVHRGGETCEAARAALRKAGVIS